MLSLIVPTYCERDNMEPLMTRLERVRAAVGEPLEVLVVDSGSPDGTADLAAHGLARRGLGRVIGLSPHTGLAEAVVIGMQAATGDLIGVMDADLSHPPELLPALIRSVRAGYEVAVASRYRPGGGVVGWSWARRVLSRLGNRLARPLVSVTDATSGYFVCRAEIARSLSEHPGGFKILLELLVTCSVQRVHEVPYVFTDRARGASKLRGRILWAYVSQLVRLYGWRRRRHHPGREIASREGLVVPGRAADRHRESLSVLLLAKNEAHRITSCLERVRWADEIVVVDDMSTDRTAEICRAYGARVAQRPFDNFANQANFGLQHVTGDWVLSLDADELMTPELRERIEAVLREGAGCVAFTFNRLNFFLKRPMRFGGWHHRSLHLFRRDAGRFEGAVHHAPRVSGPIGHLEADMEHHPFQSLAQFVERQNRYTTMEARLLLDEQPVRSGCRLLARLCVRPVKLFRKSYVKKQGRREGMHGLVFGVLFSWVEFLKWAKYWALRLPRAEGWKAATDESSAMAPPPDVSGSSRERLSAVLIAKNEERRIERCLASIRWADEIIVVDGLSTDRTAEICERYGATVIPHAFSGDFGHERNIGNEAATGEWILQLDADDAVSPELRAQIERILREGSASVAYKFRRRNWFLGHEMRFGGWYHYYPHLFRRGQAHFEGRVHHLLKTQGPLGTLEGALEHRPFDNLEEFVARHNRYTSLEAREMLDRNRVPDERLIRYHVTRKPLKLLWKLYVKKGGFREGWHGLVFSILFVWVHFLKWAKYWELSAAQTAVEQGPQAGIRRRSELPSAMVGAS